MGDQALLAAAVPLSSFATHRKGASDHRTKETSAPDSDAVPPSAIETCFMRTTSTCGMPTVGSDGLKVGRVPDKVASNGENVGRPSPTVRGH